MPHYSPLDAPMTAWSASGGARLEPDNAPGLVFNDGTGEGVHLLRLAHAGLANMMVQLELRVRPLPGCTTQLLVQHPQLGVVCRISPAGVVTLPGIAVAAEVHREADGALVARVTYFSSIASIAVGTAGPLPVYQGTGVAQYRFEALSLATAPAAADSEASVVLEIGVETQFTPVWRRLMPQMLPVAVPRPGMDRAPLAAAMRQYPGGRLVDAVLYNKKGRRKLNRSAVAARSSLLAVDRRTLRKFADPAPFEVLEQVSVDCVRYDELHAAGLAPAPHAVRMDAQGAEYEVLQGMGELLGGCLVLQLRTALYPVYKGQKLLSEVAALLDKADFTLAALTPLPQDGQVVEAQVVFVKSPDWAAGQSEAVRQRLAQLCGAVGVRSLG